MSDVTPTLAEIQQRRAAFRERIARAAEGVRQVDEDEIDLSMEARRRSAEQQWDAFAEERRRRNEERRAEALEELMRKYPPPPTFPMRSIVEVTALEFGLTPNDILGDGRTRRLVIPRHIAMWIAATTERWPVLAIARYFGRDHATVFHAISRVPGHLRRSTEMLEKLLRIVSGCSLRAEDKARVLSRVQAIMEEACSDVDALMEHARKEVEQ